MNGFSNIKTNRFLVTVICVISIFLLFLIDNTRIVNSTNDKNYFRKFFTVRGKEKSVLRNDVRVLHHFQKERIPITSQLFFFLCQ